MQSQYIELGWLAGHIIGVKQRMLHFVLISLISSSAFLLSCVFAIEPDMSQLDDITDILHSAELVARHFSLHHLVNLKVHITHCDWQPILLHLRRTAGLV